MTTSRRDFLRVSAAGSLITLAGAPSALASTALRGGRAGSAGKKILILGGTGFLGPACTDSARARGHTVTLFNRGRSEGRRKSAGRPSAVPEGVEVLYGNRDPEKTADADNDESKGEKKDPNSPKGLSQLEGHTWDAVIDTSGYWPRMVKASAEALAPSVKQYVFISSISVYPKNDTPDQDETAETAVLKDPTTEQFGSRFENYGAGKAACEAAAEAAMPGRTTSIRAGFIVGARDGSKRFIYWPVRASQGGPMIVPGTPTDPMQVIDVRDLADFIVRCIEQGTMGPFNVTGPEKPYTMKAFVDGCIKGVGGSATPEWIPTDFLEKQDVKQNFPLWLPPEGESAGFHRRSVARAIKAGLTFRPLEDTAKATLDWYNSLPPDLQKAMVPPMMPPEREAEVIKAWHEEQGKK
jgi:2'-hydroxyisoflavone reductase